MLLELSNALAKGVRGRPCLLQLPLGSLGQLPLVAHLLLCLRSTSNRVGGLLLCMLEPLGKLRGQRPP